MYNYCLLENEEVINIFDDILLKIGNDNIDVSVIITNMRFIILYLFWLIKLYILSVFNKK